MRVLFIALLVNTACVPMYAEEYVVLQDYTKVMVYATEGGSLQPVTSLSEATRAGFFFTKKEDALMRICNEYDTYFWVEGTLYDKFSSCKVISTKHIFDLFPKDTLYISFSSNHTLQGLVCQSVTEGKQQTIKEDPANRRMVRDELYEFSFIIILILIMLAAAMLSINPQKFSQSFKGLFTLKVDFYEVSGMNPLDLLNILSIFFLSCLVAYLGIYLDAVMGASFFKVEGSLVSFFARWVLLVFYMISFVLFKWLVIILISNLFKFKGLGKYQLLDFVNFCTLTLVVFTGFVFFDLLFNAHTDTWLSKETLQVFPLVLILFVGWFTLKFVSNSAHKKLIIISYLCATEIIPMIFLLSWFYK